MTLNDASPTNSKPRLELAENIVTGQHSLVCPRETYDTSLFNIRNVSEEVFAAAKHNLSGWENYLEHFTDYYFKKVKIIVSREFFPTFTNIDLAAISSPKEFFAAGSNMGAKEAALEYFRPLKERSDASVHALLGLQALIELRTGFLVSASITADNVYLGLDSASVQTSRKRTILSKL